MWECEPIFPVNKGEITIVNLIGLLKQFRIVLNSGCPIFLFNFSPYLCILKITTMGFLAFFLIVIGIVNGKTGLVLLGCLVYLLSYKTKKSK